MPSAATGTVRVFDTMGTTVSVLFADRLPAEAIDPPLRRVRRLFADADARYSLYRPDSELSLIAAGRLRLTAASEELRQRYAEAIYWRNATNGAFTPHRGDGAVDLSGLIKGWAIAGAGEILREHGHTSWCINAGGDVLISGTNRARPWTVGIVDPFDRAALIASVRATERLGSVATSGSAERGNHIWSADAGGTGQFVQVTVAARDIITADVLATAIVAGGREVLDQTASWRAEAFAVDRAGGLIATPGFRDLLASG